MIALASICLVILLTIAASPAHSAPRLIPQPPNLAAKSWILIDAQSGHVIVQNNADETLPPASLTKMMTSYIAAEQIETGNIAMDDEVLISKKAWRKGGSKMYIREGTRVSLEDLLKGVIIQSGNDASIAVSEHVAGSEDAFADLMNQTAVTLDMQNSHFMNATGWPADDHYTTASDLSKLARAIIYDHPDHYSVYAEKEFTYNNIRQPNRNKLLWRDSSVDGLKTGHTNAAGYCLVASAKRNDMRLISVVMGTKSIDARAAESQKLLTYGFRFFETVKSYNAQEALVTPDIWMGAADQVQLGSADDILLTIPRGAEKEIKAELDFPSEIRAPLTAGQVVGTIKLLLDGKIIHESPLSALESIEEAGFIKRIWHMILIFFIGLIS
ncbi:serine-type D-Ala-D-Ala carboxypeptidase [Gammaproteobacteria bacterium 45_16_T64]|nr:serine-type D-Ala-D-Ala carboxypeptidase [Gammaproteobacteria bacterium 45_16_T64]